MRAGAVTLHSPICPRVGVDTSTDDITPQLEVRSDQARRALDFLEPDEGEFDGFALDADNVVVPPALATPVQMTGSVAVMSVRRTLPERPAAPLAPRKVHGKDNSALPPAAGPRRRPEASAASGGSAATVATKAAKHVALPPTLTRDAIENMLAAMQPAVRAHFSSTVMRLLE
jgi:hypothetical protein